MLKYDSKGLIPAIIQNANTGKVLMLGYINEESLKITIETGKVCFYSRSRKKLWQKGETSGNYLNVREILKDCDEDALLIKVDPIGPTCHTGNRKPIFQMALTWYKDFLNKDELELLWKELDDAHNPLI